MTRARVLSSVVAAVAMLTALLVSAPGAGAQSKEWALLNDSPAYSFGGGTPGRNAPLLVASLRGEKDGSALNFEVTGVVSFVPAGTPISARIGFYSQPKLRTEITGGIEFSLTGTGAVTGRLVERIAVATATTAEVWEDADEEFGAVDGEYTTYGVNITIRPMGEYKSLLRDPLTAVGLDLWTGPAGGAIQPSVRVSLGDLTGAKPGLLPQQGTGIAADGTPQPWITRPVDKEFYGWKVRALATADDPQHASLSVGKYFTDASQVRLLVGNQFDALPAGSTFPPYDLVLFGPKDKTAIHRYGDAYLSNEYGDVTIKSAGKGRWDLSFTMQMHAGYAATSVVVPGDTDAVLLATGYQVKF